MNSRNAVAFQIQKQRRWQASIYYDTPRPCPSCGVTTNQQLVYQHKHAHGTRERYKCHKCGVQNG